jgi:protein Tex
LDNTPVHPESYAKVYALCRLLGVAPSAELADLARQRQKSDPDLAGRLGLGLATFEDILEALAKPGRDPREDLPQPVLRSDVLELADLKPGMVLEGVVRNVVDFGAFVDIGVHQDGLVHLSELSDTYVRNAQSVVQTGQAVQVRVLQVDPAKKRISLSMKGMGRPAVPGQTGQGQPVPERPDPGLQGPG